jgi:hypothetical protein
MKKTIAVDFDGVIHDYSHGWCAGAVYGDPLPGAAEGLRKLSIHYKLVLLTARHNLTEVDAWLRKHHLSHYFADVTNRKPAAVVYLDDRALKFESWEQTLEDLV